MFGQYVADQVAGVFADHGESMTLRRLGTPNADVAVKAKQFGATSSTVVNGQTRVTKTFKLSNAEIAADDWPGPPRAKDQMIDAAGKTFIVLDCDTRKDGDVVLVHMLTVVGSA